MKRLTSVTIAILTIGGFLLFGVGTVHATMFTPDDGPTVLDNWNVQELFDSDDQVIVQSGMYDGSTAMLLYWEGGIPDTVGAQAIDKLWYGFTCKSGDSNCLTWTGLGGPEPVDPPGPVKPTLAGSSGAVEHIYLYDAALMTAIMEITDQWDLNKGNPTNADGFDMDFASGATQTPGNSGDPGGESQTNALLFVLYGMVDLTGDYAVHVRYDGTDCSGFASNVRLREPENPDDPVRESKPTCAAVPEPSSVGLLGVALFALAGLAAWRRRRLFLQSQIK